MAAEYRIIVPIDPTAATSGAAQVKQELQGIQSTAQQTAQAITIAFDSSAFDKSVGALSSKIDGLTASFKGVNDGNDAVAASVKTVADAIDKMTAKMQAATTASKDKGDADDKQATSNAKLESTLRRVLAATDEQASNELKLNTIRKDADTLLAAKLIDETKHAAILQQVTQLEQGHTNSLAQQRQGVMILGEQFRQYSTEVLAGISPVQAFAQQAGQAAFAMQFLGGEAGKIGTFLAGPWGTIVIIATTVLAGLVAEHIKMGSAVDEAVEKMKKQATQSEVNKTATEKFKMSLEGNTQAVNDNWAALNKVDDSLKSAAEKMVETTKNTLASTIAIRLNTQALLEQAIAQQRLVKDAPRATTGEDALVNTAVQMGADARVDALQKQLDANKQAQNLAEQALLRAQANVSVDDGKKDEAAQIRDKYEGPNGLIEKAKQEAIAQKNVGTALKDQIATLEKKEQLEIQAAERRKQQQRDEANGAVYQDFGLPVQGRITGQLNEQRAARAGVAAHVHQGVDIAVANGTPIYAPAAGTVDFAGPRGAYGNLLTVNSGAGTQERFGHLSEILVKLGDQIEKGQLIGRTGGVAGAPGSGDSTGAHLHYELRVGGRSVNPVGRYRVDSSAADDDAAKKAAEQQKLQLDASAFLKNLDSQGNKKGALNEQDLLQANITATIDEYTKRFVKLGEVSDATRKKITDALTKTVQQEDAKHFIDTYVTPLELLKATFGVTGDALDIFNKEVAERIRLGRDLSPVEKQQIENSVNLGNELRREQTILTSLRKPQMDYENSIKDLNALKKAGLITDREYNSEMSKLGTAARTLVSNTAGGQRNAQGRYQSYSQIGQRGQEDDRYKQELADLKSNRAEILKLGLNYDKLEEDAKTDHEARLRAIDNASRNARLESAQSIADSLLSIVEDSVGKQSAAYKAMFVIDKGFAIATSIIKIQQGIAEAAANPFPQNLAAIASVVAATASIVSNIQAVTLAFSDGGSVARAAAGLQAGAGGPRDDLMRVGVSPGEYIVNAAAVSRPGNMEMLDAMNSGSYSAGINQAPSAAGSAMATSGGDLTTIQIGDVHVHMPEGTDAKDANATGKAVQTQMRALIQDEIKKAQRPGGSLTRTRPSVMSK